MDILSYLSELLQTRKIIGIAGLGTLYKKKKPGRYDAETHSFIPPGYTLAFTSEIKEEIVLPALISKNRRVSAETSIYFINEFSTAILQQLNDHQEARLGDLGKLLKVNEEITFEPADASTYGFDFYGLPAVKAEEPLAEELIPETPSVEESQAEIAREEQHLIITEVPEDEDNAEPIVTEEMPVVEEDIPVDEPTLASVEAENAIMEENPGDDEVVTDEITEDKKNEKQLRAEIEALNFYRSQTEIKAAVKEPMEVIWELNEPKAEAAAITPLPAAVEPIAIFNTEQEEAKSDTSLIKILLCVVIFVLMMTAAYFVNPEWFKELTGKGTVAKKAVKSTHIREVYPNPDSTKIADTTEKSIAPVSSAPKDSLISTTPPLPKDTAGTYEIIGASMHDQTEADNFIKLMARSGIKAKVVTHMSGKRLKISIATLKDEKSAKLELNRLTEKLKIPGIYIYRNKQ